ncbi:MAG: hypothetical protein NVV74_20310 [Magnetospirillum sp.]|nr:hypothetical protein [Magnetospirillum sp.]
MSARDVLFEFRRIGNYVKVSALDAETGVEVSIVGDAAAGEMRLKQTAQKKLEYVMAKHRRNLDQ